MTDDHDIDISDYSTFAAYIDDYQHELEREINDILHSDNHDVDPADYDSFDEFMDDYWHALERQFADGLDGGPVDINDYDSASAFFKAALANLDDRLLD